MQANGKRQSNIPAPPSMSTFAPEQPPLATGKRSLPKDDKPKLNKKSGKKQREKLLSLKLDPSSPFLV